MIDKMKHYSLTNPASVYDEEALTALELAGRTAQKVNAVIEYLDEATSQVERIPEVVKQEVDVHIKDGSFDSAINHYIGNLEERVDNILENVPEGGTTMDAEVIDGRVGVDGYVFSNLGNAIREQCADAKESTDDKVSARALECGYKKNLNHRGLWYQGWLSEETGELGTTGTDYDRYICTKWIPEEVERVITNGHPMEVFVYSKTQTFLHKESGRLTDYKFNHTSYKYRIHVTTYTDKMGSEWTSFKDICTIVKDYKDILFLAEPIEDAADTVSASAEKHGYKRDLNIRSLWSQGYIYGATGIDGIDPAGYDYWLYSRSGWLPAAVEKIAVDAGFKARLFKYDIRGTFIGNELVTGVSDYLDTSYRYKVDVTTTNNKLGDRHLVNDVWDKVKLLSEKSGTSTGAGTSAGVSSPFKTDAIFRPYSHKYIPVEVDEICETISHVALTELDNILFTEMVCDENYDTLGLTGRGKGIYKWQFSPSIVDANTPKIVIIGGQHGFERGSVLGLCKFVNLMMYGYVPDILRHAQITVVPCANPDGFLENTYKNSYNVNLNRNYDYCWKEEDTSSDQYGGLYPFDQVETQVIRELIISEKPDLVIDFHSLGSGAVTKYEDMNVFYACGFTDPYYMRLKNAIRWHINGLSDHGESDRMEGFPPYGRYTGFDGTVNDKPSLDNWCAYKLNTLALTVEGCNGSPLHGLLSPELVALNCEIILNFICEFLAEYSRG